MTTWPTIKPLDAFERPPFPVDAFPKVLRDFVEALSEALQVPNDLPGNLILTAVAIPVAKRYIVQIDPSWSQPLNIYTVTALPPAHRKSAAFKAVMQPVNDMEKQICRKLAPIAKQRDNEIRILKKRLGQAEKLAIEAEPGEQELALQTFHELSEQMPEPIHMPQLIADNVTTEALIELLADNGGRMAITSSEGGIFSIMSGLYDKSGSGANIDVYLKGHDGDDMRTDRKSSAGNMVDDPALTIGLTVQPGVLLEMVQNASFRVRGLPARFLYSYPHAPLGNRLIDTQPVLPAIYAAYTNLVKHLFSHSIKNSGEINLLPETITLSPEARNLFRNYRHENEKSLGPGQRLECIIDWAGKICGQVSRIAAILHACEHTDNPADTPISVDTIASAIMLGEYYEAHALAVFGQIGETTSANAEYFLEWVIKHDTATFTARDAFTAVKSKRFATMKAFEPVLTVLERHHYIRRLPDTERSGPGQKPSPTYEINPAIRTHNPQNQQIA